VRHTSFLPLTLVVCGLSVAACGDSTPTGTNSGDPLTNDEISAIFASPIGALIGEVLDFEGAAASLRAPVDDAAVSLSSAAETFSRTLTCTSGGSVSASGDVTTSETSVSVDVTESINGCVVTAGTEQITVNGDPNVKIVATGTFTATGGSVSVDIDGGIRYTSGNRSGSCAVDVHLALALSTTGESETVTGTLCGVAADLIEFDDDVDNSLTTAELSAIFDSEVFGLMAGVVFTGDTTVSAPPSASNILRFVSLAPIEIDESFSDSQACSGGGSSSATVSLVGSFDDQTFDGSLNLTGTQTFSACAFTTPGATVTVNGDPNLTMAGTFVVSNSGQSLIFTLDFTGGFTYTTSNDRAESCDVSVHVSASADPSTGDITDTITGTFCGRNVSELSS